MNNIKISMQVEHIPTDEKEDDSFLDVFNATIMKEVKGLSNQECANLISEIVEIVQQAVEKQNAH